MRILIVEDEFLIALDIEDAVQSLGHEVVGPANSFSRAKELAPDVDVALVDVRLVDGVTGPDIAEHLSSSHGATVVFMTGNPEVVRASTAAIGVLTKPFKSGQVAEVVRYATAVRQGRHPVPPAGLELLPAT
ncbi:response regulator [Rhizobium hainanense]|uniref:Response regulator receiver domain-containing protein n=1 Tax=Rhizobium hainanense TaxID=52131 RepID=A0A1C3WCK3_9HYPH|nr:response regulator [Rhizobium hainanense]SCB37568.1 Response regulator receiver domain-containing protein [Rhizobium hainanense]